MSQAECQMLMSGKGCPACEGKPVHDCTKFRGIHVHYSCLKESCEHLEWGQTCSNPDDCEFKQSRKRVDDVEFLTSLANNTDGNEALDAAMQIEFEERKKGSTGPL